MWLILQVTYRHREVRSERDSPINEDITPDVSGRQAVDEHDLGQSQQHGKHCHCGVCSVWT